MKRKTVITIKDDMFFINDKPTYEGREWDGHNIEGLLLNSRMVQGIFDDMNPESVHNFVYPDTGTWDAERNNREFIEAMPSWRKHGLLAFTINLQGGNPRNYTWPQPWHNSALTEDGELREQYMNRLERILDKADELGMAVILGIFYFGQDQRLKGEPEIKNGIANALNWLFDKGYTNVIIEINNECNVKYDHEILKPDRVHELIEYAKTIERDGRRFMVGTSYGGGTVSKENVVGASDFILMHGNGVSDPDRIAEMVRQVRQVPGYTPMPILFNEDDHFDFDKRNFNFKAAISEYASWGYYDPGDETPYHDGYQHVPVNWTICSDRKKAFFRLVKEISGM